MEEIIKDEYNKFIEKGEKNGLNMRATSCLPERAVLLWEIMTHIRDGPPPILWTAS